MQRSLMISGSITRIRCCCFARSRCTGAGGAHELVRATTRRTGQVQGVRGERSRDLAQQPRCAAHPRRARCGSLLSRRATDNALLVPLTNSLYVPGTLADTQHVIVDVGTGFYVKKARASVCERAVAHRGAQTREEARAYYRAKVDGLQTNLDQLQNTISVKQDNVNVVLQIMQAKIRAQTNAPGPSAAAKG